VKTSIWLGAILALAAWARADEIETPHITVYGTAETRVVPDLMIWSVSVKTTDLKLDRAAAGNAEAVKAVLSLLADNGVEAEDVQTAGMEFGVNWVQRNRESVKEGYYAYTGVSFRSSDLSRYAALWLGLAVLPGVSVEDVSYDHTDRIGLQNSTREEAVRRAKTKAADLAAILGSSLGEPLLVEEDLSAAEGWRSTSRLMVQNSIELSGAGSAGDGLAVGRIVIRQRVRTVFRLVSPAP